MSNGIQIKKKLSCTIRTPSQERTLSRSHLIKNILYQDRTLSRTYPIKIEPIKNVPYQERTLSRSNPIKYLPYQNRTLSRTYLIIICSPYPPRVHPKRLGLGFG